MSIFDGVIDRMANAIANRIIGDEGKPIARARAYRNGAQDRQLKVRANQFDDNLTVNFVGLIVDRAVSQMFGGGVEYDFDGDTETEQERYIHAVLDANKQEILFHRSALAAAEAGTGYWMIIPNGVVGQDGKLYPRVQLVDPAFVRMETAPEDFEIVLRWIVEYKFTNAAGKDAKRRRVIEQGAEITAENPNGDPETWYIKDYEASDLTGNRWMLVSQVPFVNARNEPMLYAPMIYWQNQPTVDSVYGEPDITTDIIELQDRVNFLSSNLSKIIRLYAHPQRIGKNIKDKEVIDMGPDKMLLVSGDNAGVEQLDALGDLPGSMGFLQFLRRAIFDNGRMVDIDSIGDKLGSLTNFGLRVLYQDNLSKIATKRELMGDAMEDLIIRLQLLAGMEPVIAKIIWSDFLPVDPVSHGAALQSDLNMGIVSKETVAAQRGYDWQAEQERIANEQSASNANENNIGALLLKNFTNGV